MIVKKHCQKAASGVYTLMNNNRNMHLPKLVAKLYCACRIC